MGLLVLTIPPVERLEQHAELGPLPRRFYVPRSWKYAW